MSEHTRDGTGVHASDKGVKDAPQEPQGGPPRPLVEEWTQGTNLTPEHPLGRLMGQERWCVWRWVRKGSGKWTKKPERPAPEGQGWGLATNKPGEGRSYEAARAAVLRGDADGVGWLLLGEPELVWLDLDKCRDVKTGVLDPWATAVLQRIGKCYMELTPSGTGVRAVGKAEDIPHEGQTRVDIRRVLAGAGPYQIAEWGGVREAREGAAIEVFHNCARFVTVTGAWSQLTMPGGTRRPTPGKAGL